MEKDESMLYEETAASVRLIMNFSRKFINLLMLKEIRSAKFAFVVYLRIRSRVETEEEGREARKIKSPEESF